MNLFQRVLYSILFIKEKFLSCSLKNRMRLSFKNSTSKTFIGKGYSLDINAKTIDNIKAVKDEMTLLVKKSKYNTEILLNYVKEKNIKTIFIKDITRILNLLGEEQGFITERSGFDGFIINLLSKNGISLKSKPVIILEKDNKDFYYLLFNVYKLCGYLHELPGYDIQSQKLFKIYSKLGAKSDTSSLIPSQVNSLKEAVCRDNEASSFVIEIAKIKDNSVKFAKEN